MKAQNSGSGWEGLQDVEAERLRELLAEMGDVASQHHFGLTITTLARAAAGLTCQQGTLAVIRQGLAV